MTELSADEYRIKWHEEKRKQYERGQRFINAIKSGDEVKIERWPIKSTVGDPYTMSEYKDIHEKKTVKIFAVVNKPGAVYFTTTAGEAIDADSIIKWEIQKSLFD